jgi:hypothetical protein
VKIRYEVTGRAAPERPRQGWVLIVNLPDWLMRIFGKPNYYRFTKSEAEPK